MQFIYERCCGLDVHQKTITACIITPKGKVVRTFGTMTGEILELVEWIKEHQCTHVAMESTGVYWLSLIHISEPTRLGMISYAV